MKLPIAGMLAAAGLLAGCVSTDVTPVAQNVIIINTSAAPVCGGRGAREVAFRQAAAETIRRGYDVFFVIDSASQNNVRTTGYTVTQYGVTANVGGSRDQSLAIAMFRYGDPQGVNGLDARAELGPDWAAIVAQSQVICF